MEIRGQRKKKKWENIKKTGKETEREGKGRSNKGRLSGQNEKLNSACQAEKE